ncbi:MAG: clostripain-related cysteine peptidase [Acidobacteriota bacterium]
MKNWTIMIYMASDNDLGDESIGALKGLFAVGVNANFAVVVQFDPFGKDNSRRYVLSTPRGEFALDKDGVLEKSGVKKRVPPTYTKKKGALRSYLAQRIREFFDFAIQGCPAENYLLVLAGHGSGAVGEVLMLDTSPLSFLSLTDVRDILKKISPTIKKINGKDKIDILGFDSCAMSALEVGYELKDYIRYLVAAEGLESSLGWPYFRLTATLKEKADFTPEELAHLLVKTHTAFYADFATSGISGDLAVCDMQNIEGLKKSVANLAKVLLKKMSEEVKSRDTVKRVTQAIITAHWEAQSYKFEEYTDLWDFCDLLEHHCEDEKVINVCREVKKSISNESNQQGDLYPGAKEKTRYVLKSCYAGGCYQHSHGVSIFFPWVEDELGWKGYDKLRFVKDSNWKGFLKSYLDSTTRKPRPSANPRARLQPVVAKAIATGFRYVPPYTRYVPPYSKYVPPYSKGFMGEGKVKNPPRKYFVDVYE